MGGAILPGEDHVQRAWGGRCGNLGMRPSDEKILETGSRRRDGNSLENERRFMGSPLKYGKGKPPKDSGAEGGGQEDLLVAARLASDRFRDPSAFG